MRRPSELRILEAVFSQILGEEISPLYLQPEPSLTGENGNGWKGVWSWCHTPFTPLYTDVG